MADPTSNTCAICMETLWAGGTIGANVPCGHLFHVDCGEGWRQSLQLQHRRLCCPLCKVPSTTFCRLFIDSVDPVEDDVSLSDSDDEEEEGEQNEESGEPTSTSSCTPPASGSGPDDIICLLEDDDEVNETGKGIKQKPEGSMSTRKVKEKAKRLKRQLKALQIKHETTMDTLHEVRDASRDLEGRIQELEVENNLLKGAGHDQQMELEHLKLRKVQMERTCDELTRKLKSAEHRADEAEKSLKYARSDYSRQLEKASKNSVKEVDHIISDLKREQQKSLRLEQDLHKYKQLCATLRDGIEPSRAPPRPTAQSKRVHSAKDMIKHLRQMDGKARREEKRADDESRKAESLKMAHAGKYSATAARLARASEKPSSRPSGISALDMLRPEKEPLEQQVKEKENRMIQAKSSGLPALKKLKTGKANSNNCGFMYTE